MENQSEVDVNLLIKIYNSKLAAISNQNVLLEAKLATMSQDFKEQMDVLVEENADLKAQLEG